MHPQYSTRYLWQQQYDLNGDIPSSEARNVALYKLFFTKGDSRSKIAMVVMRPVYWSILSQLAGSESLEYLREEEEEEVYTVVHNPYFSLRLESRVICKFFSLNTEAV